MPILNGEEGSVTVDAASDIKTLIEAAKSTAWSISYNQPSLVTTGHGDTFETKVAGVYDWTASIDLVYPTAPELGSKGLVTYAAGYTTSILRYSLNISWPETVLTVMDGDVSAKVAYPGYPSWSGSYEALLDDTVIPKVGSTAADAPGGSGNAATFRLRDDTPDDTLAGNILVTSVTPTATAGDLQRVTIAFEGAGSLTAAGDANLFAAGVIGKSATTEVVYLQDASETYTGNAFMTGVAITVDPEAVMTAQVTQRGSGALTTAT
jgi:hypothetical protein